MRLYGDVGLQIWAAVQFQEFSILKYAHRSHLANAEWQQLLCPSGGFGER